MVFRVYGRRLGYIIRIRVLSEAGLSDMTVSRNFSVAPVAASQTSEDDNTSIIVASCVVCGILVMVVVGLTLYVTRLRHRKRQLRFEND